MKVVAAYLLAHLGGNANPSAADISKILSSGAYGSGMARCRAWAQPQAAGLESKPEIEII